MIKSIKRYLVYFKLKKIDIQIYVMTRDTIYQFKKFEYQIQSEQISKNVKRYFIEVDSVMIHQSFLYQSLNILKLIGKRGPAIGNCITLHSHRGKSIYPYVINKIACKILQNNVCDEVFVLVNTSNINSIKGIEKAGFKLHSQIKATRFLLHYFNLVNTKIMLGNYIILTTVFIETILSQTSFLISIV